MARETSESKPPDKTASLSTAIQLLRAALETAPNPRTVDGPPIYWEWYDKTRADALDLTKDL